MWMIQAEYARHSGVSRQRINSLVKKGRLTLVDNKIDSEAADAILKGDNLSAVPSTEVDDSSMSMAAAQTMLANVKVDLAQLQLDEKRGKMVSVEMVNRTAFELGRLVRNRIMAVIPKVTGQLTNVASEHAIAQILREELIKALES